MADYKETNVSGKQWQRCNKIIIENTFGVVPRITLWEEQITSVGDQKFQQPSGALNIPFDPNATIQLMNPANGLPLGVTMTQGQIHVALWSLYMHEAVKRDAALIAAEAARVEAEAARISAEPPPVVSP